MHRRIAVLAMFVLLLTPLSVYASGPCHGGHHPPDDGCPTFLKRLSPLELWNWRLEKMLAADIDAVMCTYAPDAVVMMAGQVMRGRDEIRAGLEMMFVFFPNGPTITMVTEAKGVLQVHFHAEGPMVTVPDGADTFVVGKRGLFEVQTVHSSMVPTVQQ
ncbi:MAG: nuclear transport factor 2 family protein [Myxococcales bacterium]|jgi:hypothetical protein